MNKRLNNLKIKLSADVKFIISQLNSFGYEAFAVGGCVRDAIMGLEPHDWDVCTSAKPEQIKVCFKDFNTFDSGIKHGTISVVLNDTVYEVTTYRIDGEYTDNRHPNSVEFTDEITKDLARRDFTVNSMAYNEQQGFVDPFVGIEDIKNNVIRCVGNPDKRFDEDALRILRALRFSSVYGFKIEKNTSSAIKRKAHLLKNIAFERINSEFSKLLCGNYAEPILIEYREVFAVFIPEIKPMFDFEPDNIHNKRNLWRHTVSAVKSVENDLLLKLTMLLHDIGKPYFCTADENDTCDFFNHQKIGIDISRKILNRLKYPSKFIDDCLLLIRYHDLRFTGSKKQIKRIMNTIGLENTERLFVVQYADICSQSDYGQAEKLKDIESARIKFDEIICDNECYTLSQLAVSGADIMQLGVKQGVEVGFILNTLLSKVIDGELTNEKSALLDFAQGFIKEE